MQPLTQAKLPRIPRRHQRAVFGFFMSLLMLGIMSMVITAFDMGLVADLLHRWVHAWAFAFVVAFPTILLVGPVVQRLVGAVLEPDSPDRSMTPSNATSINRQRFWPLSRDTLAGRNGHRG